MAIRTFVVDSGATSRLLKANRFFVIDTGNVARTIKRLFVVDSGGTARQVYQNAVYASPAVNSTDVGAASAQMTLTYTSAGAFTQAGLNVGTQESGSWVTPTSLAPGAYTIRLHVNSGALSGGGSVVDTDLALTSNRSWNIARSGAGAGTSTVSVTVTLKDGGGATVSTSTFTMSAQTFS